MGGNRSKTIHERSASGAKLWNDAAVSAAISRQMTGDFSASADLARSMHTDAAYHAAIKKRVNGLIRNDLTVQPDDEEDALQTEATELVAEHLQTMLPETELSKLDQWFQDIGATVGTVDWTFSETAWVPVLRTLNPQWLRYDQALKRWTYDTADGTVEVCPGDGRWILITDWSPGMPAGFVTSLGKTWLNKQLSDQNWSDWNDEAGFPIGLCRVPRENVSPEESDAFVADVFNARSTKTIKLPQGAGPQDSYDYELLNASGGSDGWQSFKTHVEYADRKFQVAILGGNLSSEVASSGGNRAASSTHHGVERELVQGDAQTFSTQLRQQLFKPFVEQNLGLGITAPWPRWDIKEPDDLIEESQALTGLTSFIGSIPSNFTVSNLTDIAERFGVVLVEKTNVQEGPKPTQGGQAGTGGATSDAATEPT